MENVKKFCRVNFTNKGLAKVLKVCGLSSFTPNKGEIRAFARLLYGIAFQKDDPIQFRSIPEFRGLDYVGYIIEKERLNQETGEWIRVDEIKIIGSQAFSFKDTRIAYGEVYRYRIRCVVKHTFAKVVSEVSNLDLIQKIENVIKEELEKNIQKNSALLKNITEIKQGLQSKSSSGVSTPEIDLGNGIIVKVNNNNLPVVEKKISEDINKRLSAVLGNLRVIQSALADGSISEAELTTIKNRLKQSNIELEAGRNSEIFLSQYFKGPASRNWVYVMAEENILPPTVSNIKILPNSKNQQISLFWLKPANDQRDITHYNIYRKTNLHEKWVKIADKIRQQDTTFKDSDVRFGQKYIYAMSVSDIHGYESFLSTQIQAELNPNFVVEKVEKPLKWISGVGARPDEGAVVFKKFYNTAEQIIARDSVTIGVDKRFTETTQNLLVRIKSLDTHEEKEIKITLNNKNVNNV